MLYYLVETINKQLDELAKRYDKGEFTSAEYLAEITKIVKENCGVEQAGSSSGS